MQHGQSRDEDGNAGVNMNRPNMARPLIFPDKFSSEEDFSEWIAHFNSVSMVIGWSDDDRYKWLNVHVTGKARVTLVIITAAYNATKLRSSDRGVTAKV